MKATVFASVLLVLTLTTDLCQGETSECYTFPCPFGTVSCRKTIQTIKNDKTKLAKVVSCLDGDGMSLLDNHKIEENPYGPFTDFQSTSYSGTYTYHGSDYNVGPKPINIDNSYGNQIEDFS